MESCAGCVAKLLGDRAGLQISGFHAINMTVGCMALDVNVSHARESVYIPKGTDVTRIGRGIFQVEARDFTGCPAGSEAHDLRNTGSSHSICITVEQRLDYDGVYYPEQK